MKIGVPQLILFFLLTLTCSVGAAALYVAIATPEPVRVEVPVPQEAPSTPSLPGVAAPPRNTTPSAPLPSLPGAQDSMADVVARVIPSVVNIASSHAPQSPYGSPYDMHRAPPNGRGADPRGESLGSGVVVRSDGLVVTNNHVVAGATSIRVSLSDGHSYAARVVGTDEDSDMALLRLEGTNLNLAAMPYGDSSQLRQGDVVLAIGNPFGVGQTVTMGIISAIGRASVGITELEDFIQTDAAINPGNSGGALISTRGELIGINTAILSRTGGSHGIGFAIPSNMVEPIVESLLNRGNVVRGWLGVGPQDLTPELATSLRLAEGQQGVLVSNVEEGSPAAQAGLQTGDVIEQLNGERLTSRSQLRTVVATRGAGAEISLILVRGEDRREVHLRLGERPRFAPVGGPPPLGGLADPQQGRGLAPTIPVPIPGLPGIAPIDPYAQPQQPPRPQEPPRIEGAVSVAGVQLLDLDDRFRRMLNLPRTMRGALVGNVAMGSPADLAGLRPGNVILEANREPIESAAAFARAYNERGGGITVLVHQNGMNLYTVLR